MISANKIIRLHKERYDHPKVGDALECAYCGVSFEAWYGIQDQGFRKNNSNCCKLCLDRMRHQIDVDPKHIIKTFHTGFRKKSDKTGWMELSYKDKVQFVKEIADAGIVIGLPPQ